MNSADSIIVDRELMVQSVTRWVIIAKFMCIGVDMRTFLMYTLISISILNPVQSRESRVIPSLLEIFVRDICSDG